VICVWCEPLPGFCGPHPVFHLDRPAPSTCEWSAPHDPEGDDMGSTSLVFALALSVHVHLVVASKLASSDASSTAILQNTQRASGRRDPVDPQASASLLATPQRTRTGPAFVEPTASIDGPGTTGVKSIGASGSSSSAVAAAVHAAVHVPPLAPPVAPWAARQVPGPLAPVALPAAEPLRSTGLWKPAPDSAQRGSKPLDSPPSLWHVWLAFYMPQVSHLLIGLSFAGVIKVLCMAGNILVQLSPYPQVRRWERRGCTGEADAAPYVSIAFGGWQWCFYGMFAYIVTKRSGFLILVHSNCLGALLGTYYTAAFHRNCRHQRALSSLNWYLSAALMLALLQACSLLALPAERALFLSGLISSFCSFVGACSMLVVLPTVLKSQDSRPIPGPMVLANFLSALVWCLCGWMLADPLVTGPNVVAALASVVCLYMKVQFPSDANGLSKEEQEETAVIIASMATSGKRQCQRAANEFTPLSPDVSVAASSMSDQQFEAMPIPDSAAHFSDGTGGTC